MMNRQREAFSMITAVFLILIMATIAAFIFSLSGKIIKETTNQYQKEQAVLIAKSYTELAIMAVMANDRNGTSSCISDVDGVVGPAGASANGRGYRVRTRIGFIGPNGDIGSCFAVRQLDDSVSGNELNIIVDVYVDYKDINHPNLDTANTNTTPWITYHRRTLQKI